MFTHRFLWVIARASATLLLVPACAVGQSPAKPAAAPAGKKDQAPKNAAKKGAAPTSPAGSYFEKMVPIPAPPVGAASPDAAEIVGVLGDPKPFTLRPWGADQIIIYGPKPAAKLSADENAILTQIIADIGTVAAHQSMVSEIRIAHAGALGDLVKKVQSLNYHDIRVEAAGADRIWVRLDHRISQSRLNAFLRDLRGLSASPYSDSPVARVFFIDAPDAAAVWGGGKPKPGSAQPSADKTGDKTKTPSATAATTDASAGKKEKDSKAAAPAGATDQAKDASTQKSPDGASDSSSAPPSPEPAAADKQGGADPSKPALSVQTVNNDLLVFTDPHPGNDGAISEAKRILAAIDFPRPEVIINTFSFQSSSSKPDLPYKVTDQVRKEIGIYNDRLQAGLASAWKYLSDAINQSEQLPREKKENPACQDPASAPNDCPFFDETFKNYLTKYYVAEGQLPTAAGGDGQLPTTDDGPVSIDVGDNLASHSTLSDDKRRELGICEQGKYCLGYYSLFHPLRPNLTDILLAVIAAKNPATEIRNVIVSMEQGRPSGSKLGGNTVKSLLKKYQQGDEEPKNAATQPCEERDEEEVFHVKSGPEKFPLNCFKDAAQIMFGTPEEAPGDKNLVGPLRAAVANFLFHYKMSVQYPHEFSYYDLSHSAQELNSELNPLIMAYNRDLAAALAPLKGVAHQTETNGFFGIAGHGNRFIANGIISVRTISGKETTVDTVTQNFFDATNPPTITDLVNSIGSAESNIPKVLKANLTANEAAVIIGALNAVKPAESKVGRQFKIDITPRSLSGASAAELNIVMNAQDQADPTLYRDSKSEADDLSRVAQHTTQTKVRLESARLFEISSFTATLERGRRNIPLIPPLFEIPYIGSFVSLPWPGAKEFHSSTAVMSAVVVPTAADLANGVVLTFDRVVVAKDGNAPACVLTPDPNCRLVAAKSTRDLGAYSVREYHKAMASCFGSGRHYASGKECGQLRLADIFPEE